ncbi:MAG: hypothetical protein Q9162_004413 [Coniocarpon cinnabarinum]
MSSEKLYGRVHFEHVKALYFEVMKGYVYERGFVRTINTWARLMVFFSEKPVSHMPSPRKTLFPTVTGWQLNTDEEVFHQLEETSPSPICFLLAEASKLKDKDVDIDTFFPDDSVVQLPQSQREHLFLSKLWPSRRFEWDWGELMVRSLSRIFPSGVSQPSVCLSRMLEWIRMFERELFAIPIKHDWQLPYFNMALISICNIVKIIIAFVSKGSDANTLCKSVANDPDRSQLSIILLLRRVKNYLDNDSWWVLTHTQGELDPAFSSSCKRHRSRTAFQTSAFLLTRRNLEFEWQPNLERAIDYVQSRGGQEITVSSQAHREADIGPSTMSVQDFGPLPLHCKDCSRSRAAHINTFGLRDAPDGGRRKDILATPLER